MVDPARRYFAEARERAGGRGSAPSSTCGSSSAGPCSRGRVDRLERDARRRAAGGRPQDRSQQADAPATSARHRAARRLPARRGAAARSPSTAAASAGAALLQVGKAAGAEDDAAGAAAAGRATTTRGWAGELRRRARPTGMAGARFLGHGRAARASSARCAARCPVQPEGRVTRDAPIALPAPPRPDRRRRLGDARAPTADAAGRGHRGAAAPAARGGRRRVGQDRDDGLRAWSGWSPTGTSSPTRCSA